MQIEIIHVDMGMHSILASSLKE